MWTSLGSTVAPASFHPPLLDILSTKFAKLKPCLGKLGVPLDGQSLDHFNIAARMILHNTLFPSMAVRLLLNSRCPADVILFQFGRMSTSRHTDDPITG